jgi:hypothetical protein
MNRQIPPVSAAYSNAAIAADQAGAMRELSVISEGKSG